MDPVLALRSLTKHYSTQLAVNGISLAIERGEFFSLVGPSGCGKTTTLRLIAGFEMPTAGDILLNGNSVTALKPYQRDVSTVFQNYALFPHLTVADNVAFGLARRRPSLARRAIARKVEATLGMVQLSGKESRLPSEISGGERQRVALARSLVLEPQVLLLDEPLSALDPKLRKQMRLELKSLQRRIGITFLFITHDQDEALSMSDRVAVMNRGLLEQVGKPQELYEKPNTTFVAEFLGDLNWIGEAAVRPEALRISHHAPKNGSRSKAAVIRQITFLGHRIDIHTYLRDGSECIVQQARLEKQFEPGDAVYVWWRMSDELKIRPGK